MFSARTAWGEESCWGFKVVQVQISKDIRRIPLDLSNGSLLRYLGMCGMLEIGAEEPHDRDNL